MPVVRARFAVESRKTEQDISLAYRLACTVYWKHRNTHEGDVPLPVSPYRFAAVEMATDITQRNKTDRTDHKFLFHCRELRSDNWVKREIRPGTMFYCTMAVITTNHPRHHFLYYYHHHHHHLEPTILLCSCVRYFIETFMHFILMLLLIPKRGMDLPARLKPSCVVLQSESSAGQQGTSSMVREPRASASGSE